MPMPHAVLASALASPPASSPAAGWLTGPALAWVLVAVAILLVPGRRPVRTSPTNPVVRATDPVDAASPVPRGSRPAGPVLAAVAAGAACVLLFGSARGLLGGLIVAAVVGAGLVWLQRRPTPAAADPALPLVLDLVAAALRSGRPLADALELAAGAARADVRADLLLVCGLCRLGADAGQAWAAVASPGPLSPVVPVAVRSAQSGIKIAAAFESLSTQMRAERTAQLAARAHRAGVLAMAPLAACFLPSFICLGVVPVIAGIATSAFQVLPGGP